MNRRSFTAFIAVFAAMNVVCDALVIPQFSSGVWYGLVFLIAPITGIVLGSSAGFLATLIGVLVGHLIMPRGVEELLFTVGAPIGAAIASIAFQRRWKIPFLYYTVLLLGYVMTPVAKDLSPLGMWDVYAAYLLLLILLMAQRSDWIRQEDQSWLWFAIAAFIGLEADVLFRIFLFIPGQTYHSIYGFTIETLQGIWLAGAVITPIKVAVSAAITAILGTKLQPIRDLTNATV
jgi:hypothetical protein